MRTLSIRNTGFVGSLKPPAISMPSGALGIWYADQYNSSPRPVIRNEATYTTTPASGSFVSAPRRLFTVPQYYGQNDVTVSDGLTAADSSSNASRVIGAASDWYLFKYFYLPAGTYTVGLDVKSNTGSSQAIRFGANSVARTATTSWTSITDTFTASGTYTLVFVLRSADGSTASDILIDNLRLYAGSSDLGATTLAGHLVLGSDGGNPDTGSYASGAIDLSDGFGLIQFASPVSLGNYTVIALGQKTADAVVDHDVLTNVKDYSQFEICMDINKQPGFSYAGVQQATARDLWVPKLNLWSTITNRYNGSNVNLFLDDIKVYTFNQTGSVSLTDFWVGKLISTFQGKYKFAAIALWNRALTDTEVRTAVSVIQARAALNSISSSMGRFICAEGDSITFGIGSTSHVQLAGPNLSPTAFGVVKAISGSTLDDLNTRAAADDALLSANKNGRTFIFSVLIGRNENPSDATAYAALVGTYCQARKSAGWDKVVLGTLLPSTGTGFNTFRNAFNAIITGSGWTAAHGVDAICDFGTDATMGPDAAASNTTYYSDGTHPTLAGQTIMETIYRATINSI